VILPQGKILAKVLDPNKVDVEKKIWLDSKINAHNKNAAK